MNLRSSAYAQHHSFLPSAPIVYIINTNRVLEET